MTWFKKNYPIILILILALGLRITMLINRGDFTFDETFTAHFGSLPWPDFVKYAIMETNPPLYTLFSRFWVMVAGNVEFLMRLPSVIFSLITIFLVYSFSKKRFSQRTGIVSALFLSITELCLYINTEARVYSLLILLFLISFSLFIKIFLDGINNKKIWFFYFFVNFLLLYSHLTALYAPLLQMISFSFLRPNKGQLKKWWLGHLAIGFLWLLWFIPSIITKINLNSANAWYFNPQINRFANFLTVFNSYFFTQNSNGLTFTLFSLLAIAASYFIYQKINTKEHTKEKQLLLILVLWALLPILIAAFLNIYIIKFSIMTVPAIFILAGFVIDKKFTNKKIIFPILFIILFILPASLQLALNKFYSAQNLFAEIEKRETDNSIVMVIPFCEVLNMSRYYSGNSEMIGVYVNEDDFNLEERIVKFNWSKQVADKEKIEKWVLKQTEGRDKIFYLEYTDSLFGEIGVVGEILLENGFISNYHEKAVGMFDMTLYEFYAPNYSEAVFTTSTEQN